jgi:hypothetical protein
VALPSGAFVQGRDLTVGGDDKAKQFGPGERMTAEVLKKEKIRFIKSVVFRLSNAGLKRLTEPTPPPPSASRLVNAFVIAVKHHLRGEPGTSHEEYRGQSARRVMRSLADAGHYARCPTARLCAVRYDRRQLPDPLFHFHLHDSQRLAGPHAVHARIAAPAAEPTKTRTSRFRSPLAPSRRWATLAASRRAHALPSHARAE